MNPIVSIDHLNKSYGRTSVLSDLSLEVEPGRIVGLLGPNGCGKTTLLKILAGLIRDYQGEVSLMGRRPGEQTGSLVSFLPDRNFLASWMTPAYAIRLFSDFFADFDAGRAAALCEKFQIPQRKKLNDMSKGMKEKLQIILVMSRRARLYLLDEPLGGIDPASRDVVLDIVLDQYDGDSSLLIATHLIGDVERVFDSPVFLKDGGIYLNMEVDAIRMKYQKSVDELFREVYQW